MGAVALHGLYMPSRLGERLLACDEGGCSASTHTKIHHTPKLIAIGGSYMSEVDAEAKLACLPEQLLLLSCGWMIDAWIDAIGI